MSSGQYWNAYKKINEIDAVTILENTDQFPILKAATATQNEKLKRTNMAQIAAFANANQGTVTSHTDVSSAGSGKIITNFERETLNRTLITGLISGCDFRVNVGDNTLVDVDAGRILLIDWTDIDNPILSEITVAAQLGLSHPVGGVSRIDIASNGIVNIIAFTGQMTETEKRQGNTQIGIIGHVADGVTIDVEFTTISAIAGISSQANADLYASGIRLINGLKLTFANTDLSFGRETGRQFDPLAPNFFLTPNDPYTVAPGALATVTFQHSWRDGAGGYNFTAPITQLVVNNWDDGTGGASVPNGTLTGNQSQNFRIHEAKTKTGFNFIVQHGQTQYATVAGAAAAVTSETFANSPQVAGTAFRGWLSVKRGISDLNAAIAAGDAIWTAPTSPLITTRV